MFRGTKIFVFLCFAFFISSFDDYATAASPERPLKIDFATQNIGGTPPDKGFIRFVNNVKQRTNGAIDIKYHMATIPGSDAELTDICIRGQIGMANGVMAGTVHASPEFQVFALPFLFRNPEHYYQVVEGPMGNEFSATFEKKGLKVLSYYDFGERSLILNKRPVVEPKDLKGLKIRAMPVPMVVDMFQILGGSAVAMPSGEMIPALQQGVIDGVEIGLAAGYGNKVHEVCKYVSLTRHMITPCAFFMNLKLWNSLTNEEQKILMEEGKAMAHYATELEKAFDIDKSFQGAGLKVNEVNREAFVNGLTPLYTKYEPKFGANLIERIRATRK